jgi:UDP-N-acetylenolpyruvoylglucosamine reductase
MSATATVSRPVPAPVVGARGVSLAGRTSFKTGGTAREFHAPATIEGLEAALSSCARRGVRPFILGGGANTLFPDGEFIRPVISTEKLRWLEVDGSALVAECGVRLNYLIQTACRAGLGGLEGFVGIPGTAGGAVMMNAGGGGWSFGDRVEELGLLPIAGSRAASWSGAGGARWRGVTAAATSKTRSSPGCGCASKRPIPEICGPGRGS